MLGDGKWTYQEPDVRHAFSPCRVVEAGTADERYDLLGVIEVRPDRRDPEKLGERLRHWALTTLTAGGYGFGRYYAALGTLDEHGEPHLATTHVDIDWSGSAVLVPASIQPTASDSD
ncbi:hypothetical protein OG792_04645 [Micromonospora sp. NBC_01699]|uniref:hypothetical protein n=1 Tax=Micromonospora sp. NBC_01699 TaxID=2975984 RepID=UPI002E380957|nr:hypothetical protein [Micromonospora sp. NBC_01699]